MPEAKWTFASIFIAALVGFFVLGENVGSKVEHGPIHAASWPQGFYFLGGDSCGAVPKGLSGTPEDPELVPEAEYQRQLREYYRCVGDAEREGRADTLVWADIVAWLLLAICAVSLLALVRTRRAEARR